MSSEHAEPDGADGAGDGDLVVDVLGVEVVVEEDFVAFPWRAGFVRAPVVFLVGFTLVSLLSAFAAVGARGSPVGYLAVAGATLAFVALLGSLVRLGRDTTRAHALAGAAGLVFVAVAANYARWTGDVPFADQLAILGVVTYNTHHIHAATALVPGAFEPVAEPVLAVPVVGRLLQGLFAVGQDHAAPVAHLADVAGGATGTIGHVNLLEQQATRVPTLVYYLVPVGTLVAAGYEFAASHWEDAATDSPLEVTRFGIALGLGYVATLLVGTVFVTYQGQSPLNPQVFTVLPDRYLTAVFGFVYPAVLGSVGAALVYVRHETGADPDRRVDDGADSAGGG